MAYLKAPPCRGAQFARLHLWAPRRWLSHQGFRSRVRVTSEVKTATRGVPGLQTMPWTDSKEQKEVGAPFEGCEYSQMRYGASCVALMHAQSATLTWYSQSEFCPGEQDSNTFAILSKYVHAGTAGIAAAHARMSGRGAGCCYTAVVFT